MNDDVGPSDQPPASDLGGPADGLGWPPDDLGGRPDDLGGRPDDFGPPDDPAEPTGEPGSAGGQAGPTPRARLTAWVEGRVHGVGFRWWVRAQALELGLVGIAENLADGRVRVIAEGRQEACRELLARLEGPGTPGRVARVTQRWDRPWGGMSGFVER